MLAEGILGGVRGFANATTELSRDKLKQLSEQLRREAIAEINKQSQARGFSHDKEIQRADIEAKQKEGEKGRQSREKIATDRNVTLEKIATMENDMKERLLSQDKKSTEAQKLRAKVAAFAEARKVINEGGSTDEANAVLSAAGLPTLEEYVKEPGRGGIFGFFKKDPVMGRRISGSGDSTLKKELDDLLADSQGTQLLNSDEPTEQTDSSPPEGPGTASGLMSRALESSAPILQPDLGDPSTWDVRQQAGKFFIITSEGPREMTPDQIEQWKRAKNPQGM